MPGARADRLMSFGRSPRATSGRSATTSRVLKPITAASSARLAETSHTASKRSSPSTSSPSAGPNARPPYTATDQ